MIVNFQLDTKAAARADSQTPNIRKSGAFAEQITAARTYLTRSGAQMLEVIFVAHEGRANINLCLFKKDGSENFGRDMFMSMLTCHRLKNVNAVKSTVKDRSRNDQEAYLFPDLAGREIGFNMHLRSIKPTTEQSESLIVSIWLRRSEEYPANSMRSDRQSQSESLNEYDRRNTLKGGNTQAQHLRSLRA